MPFIVLTRHIRPDSKTRYVQFGEECATIQEARKLARFPSLRQSIIVDLKTVERVNG